MGSNQTLFTDAIYGVGNGTEIRNAISFFSEIYRDPPDAYSVEFIVDVWGRTSIDYMERIRGVSTVWNHIWKQAPQKSVFAK